MVLLYLSAKRSNYHNLEHYRDTGELLNTSGFRKAENQPASLKLLQKKAFVDTYRACFEGGILQAGPRPRA